MAMTDYPAERVLHRRQDRQGHGRREQAEELQGKGVTLERDPRRLLATVGDKAFRREGVTMLCLYVQAPFAAFRTFTAGWYRPTAAFLTPRPPTAWSSTSPGSRPAARRRRHCRPGPDQPHADSACPPCGSRSARRWPTTPASRTRRPDALPAAPQLPGRHVGQGAQGRRQGEQVQHHSRPPRVPRRPPGLRRPRLPREPRDRRPRSGVAWARLHRPAPRTACRSSATTPSCIDRLEGLPRARSPPTGIAASDADDDGRTRSAHDPAHDLDRPRRTCPGRRPPSSPRSRRRGQRTSPSRPGRSIEPPPEPCRPPSEPRGRKR